MKVLVYPHDLNIGGSQLNAIEIAAAVQDLGHTCVVFGRPGSLNTRIAELGLEFIAAPEPRRRPSPAVVRALGTAIDDHAIDVVHGYEWPPSLEASLATARRPRVAAVSTVMSMAVAPFIPRTMPLLVGTEQIAADERKRGRSRVGVLEPPVDLHHNVPPAQADLDEFCARWNIDRSKATIVCVTRLAHELKLEGILSAINAVDAVAETVPTQLIIAGDGPGRDDVRAAAATVNHRHGAGTVVLTGELDDPRPAYAVADVSVGMGGSALRALAFGAPLVVQGERGFFELLTPETVDTFFWQGWYGVGTQGTDGSRSLADILRRLITDPRRRAELGKFGLTLVQRRFSLESAARRQLSFYDQVLSDREGPLQTAVAGARSALGYSTYQVKRKASKLVGPRKSDDFNADPVAAERSLPPAKNRALVVWIAGAAWDGIPGTDRRLVSELAQDADVLWVDPAHSILQRIRDRSSRGKLAGLDPVIPGVTRLRIEGPPGLTRPGARAVTGHLLQRAIRRACAATGRPIAAVVVATPEATFPADIPGRRVYYVTDDWVAGADLMGLDQDRIRYLQKVNIARADIVAAVSPGLEVSLRSVVGDQDLVISVLPNGCEPTIDPPNSLEGRVAGLVGQLNERLDLGLLEAVVAAGVHLRVVGPRADRDPEFGEWLERFLGLPEVEWLGSRPAGDLPGLLRTMSVGLTPYADTAFNRASFPLKTLEYLSAGLPVVSTDLPAVRWLDTDLVAVGHTPDEFVGLARSAIERGSTLDEVAQRIAFATAHSWQERARQLRNLLQIADVPGADCSNG